MIFQKTFRDFYKNLAQLKFFKKFLHKLREFFEKFKDEFSKITFNKKIFYFLRKSDILH